MPEASHQADPVRRARLRWRARRGLLENDLVLKRFLDASEMELSDADVMGLSCLLELPDNELLDLILARQQPTGALATEPICRLIELLRVA
ncbi:MAG: succinate dehydrogenase assembly factor 2 [Burkholderiaceae bacterium]|jgi:antitoxin CptB